MLRSSKVRVQRIWVLIIHRAVSLNAPNVFYLVIYLGKHVDCVFQETARILAVTAIIMFLKAIARQWKLSKKNARKAVDFAR